MESNKWEMWVICVEVFQLYFEQCFLVFVFGFEDVEEGFKGYKGKFSKIGGKNRQLVKKDNFLFDVGR